MITKKKIMVLPENKYYAEEHPNIQRAAVGYWRHIIPGYHQYSSQEFSFCNLQLSFNFTVSELQ